ncbi:hypothetical protein FOZ60_003446 [Perkinsus olseni]|uniref:Uncharacterized protein n=1 Tax=Perkinsus olseni TaxID=32597 RepID=A0A7J6NWE9_PEROL|nr:hypothetical protein FOZ60_003446 [Perkinsus olseni]
MTSNINDAIPRMTRAAIARGDGSLVPGLEFGRQRREDGHEGPLPSVNDGEFLSASEHDSKVSAKHSVVIPRGSAPSTNPPRLVPTATPTVTMPPPGYQIMRVPRLIIPKMPTPKVLQILGLKALHIQENSRLGNRRHNESQPLIMSIEHKLDGIVDALAGLSLALRRPGDQHAVVNETPVADGINNANQGLVNQHRWCPTVRTSPNQEADTLFHNVSPSHLPYHQIRGSPPVYPIHTGAHYRPGLQPGHRGSPPGIMHPSLGQRPSITPGRSRTMDYSLHNAHPAGHHVPQHEPNPTAPVVGHRAAYPIVGCCYGCGCTPCAYPVSDDRLQKEMKTVKALKKPEQGKFLEMVDKRSGLGFRLEVIRNCGRLSPIVVHHYLREHVCMDVHKSIGIGDDWPLNCDADYSNSVNVIWDRLTTVYSGQSTSEKLLDSWSHLRQGDGEPVQKYVNRVCNAQEELSLAGNGRSESEIRAKLRCGLRDQRLQSDMLQYNNAPLPDFIAIMSQKVIDYDRQAGQCFSNGGAPYGQSSQFQLGWANPASDGASPLRWRPLGRLAI